MPQSRRYIVAAEIEFYLRNVPDTLPPAAIIALIQSFCEESGIKLYSVNQEKGQNQYEVAFLPSAHWQQVASKTENFKILIQGSFALHGIQTDFSAKPYPDQPGSGLHIHVHVEDKQGNNLFFSEHTSFTPQLLYAIGGLLAVMNASMPVFAPLEVSYLRFCTHSNAPTTVSWGTNNRTVAVRIPSKSLNNRHIEHRVAGSDAAVLPVIEAILDGMEYGLHHQISPPPPVYGDAALAQYQLPLLARSLAEAQSYRKIA